jgi:hypothetical protein
VLLLLLLSLTLGASMVAVLHLQCLLLLLLLLLLGACWGCSAGNLLCAAKGVDARSLAGQLVPAAPAAAAAAATAEEDVKIPGHAAAAGSHAYAPAIPKYAKQIHH